MGTWRSAGGSARPREPAATGDAASLYASFYAGGATRSDTDGGRAVVERPPPMERDLLSWFTGEGGPPRLQVQDNRQPPPPTTTTLSLRLGFEEEQQNRVDATIHGQAPQQASVGELGHSAQHVLPGGATAPPPMCSPDSSPAGLAPRRPPRAPLPKDHNTHHASGSTAQQDRNVRDHHRARALRPGAWSLGGVRETTAQVAHRPACRCAAPTMEEKAWSEVQRFNAALAAAGPAVVSSAAAMQRICADVGIRCPGCRVMPPNVQLQPSVHLCLCRHCAYAFRDVPTVGCPFCVVVPPARGNRV